MPRLQRFDKVPPLAGNPSTAANICLAFEKNAAKGVHTNAKNTTNGRMAHVEWTGHPPVMSASVSSARLGVVVVSPSTLPDKPSTSPSKTARFAIWPTLPDSIIPQDVADELGAEILPLVVPRVAPMLIPGGAVAMYAQLNIVGTTLLRLDDKLGTQVWPAPIPRKKEFRFLVTPDLRTEGILGRNVAEHMILLYRVWENRFYVGRDAHDNDNLLG